MGPSQASNNAYVNPVDVHASHHHIESFFDAEGSNDFSLQAQGASFNFDVAYDPTTPFDLEPPTVEEEEEQQQQSQVFAKSISRSLVASTSAEHTVIKDEIEAASQYPDPSPTQADLEEDDEEEPIFELPPNKRKSVEDEAFQPTSSKRPRGAASTKAPPPSLSVRGSTRRPTTAAAKQTPSRRSSTGDAVPIKQKIKMATPSASGLATTTSTSSTAATKQGGPFPCPECPQNSFKDQLSLDNHIKKLHTRAYHCVFHFAGCTSTFANKNEWKRHVASKHLLLQYWLCQEGGCARASNNSPEPPATRPVAKNRSRSFRSSAAQAAAAAASAVATTASASLDPPLPNGAIFNRRDLYTQHLRRMHMPPNMKKQAKQQSRKNGGSGSNSTTVGLVPEWEERLRAMASRAIRTRCMVPIFMRCPALHCDAEFSGSEAWDQRMEHVGRHLEHAAAHEEPRIEFGGADDTTLIDWASRPDVAVIRWNAGRWVLNNPLKASEKTPIVAGESILAVDPAMSAPGFLAPLGEDPTVKDEIVVDHGSDQDAEGDEDY